MTETATLPFTAPFGWDRIIAYLSRRAIPGVEAASVSGYERSVFYNGAAGVLHVRLDAGGAGLAVSCSIPGPLPLDRLRRQFDLDADPTLIADHLAADPLLAPVVARRPGLRLPKGWDSFELTVRTMVGQQVSVAGASTVTGRIARRFGTALAQKTGDDAVNRLFPTAAQLAAADLSAIGMPGKRAAAITGFARAVADGALDLDGAGGLEAKIERLCALPGIGPWTANYVAMRALGEADAFPAGDLGLQKAAAPDGGRLTARALEDMAENWRPWRAYAAMYLWASLEERG